MRARHADLWNPASRVLEAEVKDSTIGPVTNLASQRWPLPRDGTRVSRDTKHVSSDTPSSHPHSFRTHVQVLITSAPALADEIPTRPGPLNGASAPLGHESRDLAPEALSHLVCGSPADGSQMIERLPGPRPTLSPASVIPVLMPRLTARKPPLAPADYARRSRGAGQDSLARRSALQRTCSGE
jgi:hypothetical protein